jgi:hypothetical protein
MGNRENMLLLHDDPTPFLAMSPQQMQAAIGSKCLG